MMNLDACDFRYGLKPSERPASDFLHEWDDPKKSKARDGDVAAAAGLRHSRGPGRNGKVGR